MVKKIISETGDSKHDPQDSGTFELHYTPSSTDQKSFVFPVSTRRNTQHVEDNETKKFREAKVDVGPYNTQMSEISNSRH
jgi:hypothetical protein